MIGFLVSALAGSVSLSAQWLNYKTPGIPRTRDGKPKLDAPAPRALDGHPDLSGVWMHEPTSVSEWRRMLGAAVDELLKAEIPGMELVTASKYAMNVFADLAPEEAPLRPEAAQMLRERPSLDNCHEPIIWGFPLAGLASEPIKIVQARRITMVMYELGGAHRQIYTDGRGLPRDFDLRGFYGYSVGRWERDTFLVESAGFNDKTPLDGMGHPHSDQLHVTERFHRRDFGHLDYEVTFNDPKMYTRPFTIRLPHHLLPDQDIFEMYPENEKDCVHMPKAEPR